MPNMYIVLIMISTYITGLIYNNKTKTTFIIDKTIDKIIII